MKNFKLILLEFPNTLENLINQQLAEKHVGNAYYCNTFSLH